MERESDILVVGAGTAGTYYALQLARRGIPVKVIEKDKRAKVGKRLDVFHIDSDKFSEFGVPEPAENSGEFICVLKDGISLSPDGSFPKRLDYPFHVLRLTPFLNRLYVLAESAGVKFAFETTVKAPVLRDGSIIGVAAGSKGKTREYNAKLVVDATGTAAALRTSLPDDFGMETFGLAPDDKFYVVLRYLRWEDPSNARISGPWEGPLYPVEYASVGWTYYKTWIAPSSDPRGAILGIGATGSYEHAEEVLKEFLEKIKLPPYRVERIEKGTTPYRRPPYSVVGNGFLCLGDCACITKPFSGEGVTAAWRLCKIAAEETAAVIQGGGPVTGERLWNINVRYFRDQGAKFAALLATLPGAANTTAKECQYLFQNDVIFSETDFNDMNKFFEVRLSTARLLKVVYTLARGLFSGNYSFSSMRALVRALVISGKVRAHYEKYPIQPDEYTRWKVKAEELWKKAAAKMQ